MLPLTPPEEHRRNLKSQGFVVEKNASQVDFVSMHVGRHQVHVGVPQRPPRRLLCRTHYRRFLRAHFHLLVLAASIGIYSCFSFLFFIVAFHCFLVSPQSDSCSSSLNLRVSLPFDTSNLHCLSIWNSQSFILRVSTNLKPLQTHGTSFSQLHT